MPKKYMGSNEQHSNVGMRAQLQGGIFRLSQPGVFINSGISAFQLALGPVAFVANQRGLNWKTNLSKLLLCACLQGCPRNSYT
jgi:hypothetical protein